MAEANPNTPTQSTKDPELAAAEREANLAKARKERAEAEKGIAEAQRDKMKAELIPSGEQSKVTAPSGDVTTDQSGFIETQMLAQEAARKIARRLARVLSGLGDGVKTLIIYSSSELTALASYVSVIEQLKEFTREYDAIAGQATGALGDARARLANPDIAPAADLMTLGLAAPGIAAGAVKSVAELVNLFRTTTEFKNKAVTVSEDMIVSYLVKSLSTPKTGRRRQAARTDISVYYPAYFPPNIAATGNDSELAKNLRAIRVNRQTTLDHISDIDSVSAQLTNAVAVAQAESQAKEQEIATKTAQRDGLTADDPGRAALEGEILQLKTDIELRTNRIGYYQLSLDALSALKPRLQQLNTVAEQMTLGLDTPDATTKVTPLSQLVRAERLASIVDQDTSYTLRLNVMANGTTMIKKNLFLSARVQHSAGVSLVFQLFDKSGRVIYADGVQYYYGWNTAKEVRSILEEADPYDWDERQEGGVPE